MFMEKKRIGITKLIFLVKGLHFKLFKILVDLFWKWYHKGPYFNYDRNLRGEGGG